MKVRIKFSKEGPMKFVGHLDTMRYFQKALRRAELPVAFSGGYSPHMIMSFAVPLGVGMESLGDYFDLEMAEDMPTAEIAARLEGQMAEGMHIVSVRKVEDGKRVKRWRWWQQQIILWSSVRAKSLLSTGKDK